MTRGRPLPHSLLFSKKTHVAGIRPRSSGSLSLCSGTMRLGFTSQCEFTCDAASPCRILFLFPKENARRNHQEARQLPKEDMWKRRGSEQTSSVFMLWAKTRVYICSGRAGGNERDLLFYVRYEET